MDETQNQNKPAEPNANPSVEPVNPVVDTEPSPAPGTESVLSEEPAKKNNTFGTLLVTGVVVLAIAAAVLWFAREQTPESNVTGVDPDAVVATVNGENIVGADLATSVSQITATAQLQGIDTTDPNVQSEIQSQAVEMLVNTELLEQEAAARGIVVTDADVTARIDSLVAEIGSVEALNERMAVLGIDQSTLESDVKSELMIQVLLDQEFAAAEIAVTEEEVQSLYEASTGGGEDAPALEDMRPQVEAQIRASKEQAVVDEFLSELRTGADVELAQ